MVRGGIPQASAHLMQFLQLLSYAQEWRKRLNSFNDQVAKIQGKPFLPTEKHAELGKTEDLLPQEMQELDQRFQVLQWFCQLFIICKCLVDIVHKEVSPVKILLQLWELLHLNDGITCYGNCYIWMTVSPVMGIVTFEWPYHLFPTYHNVLSQSVTFRFFVVVSPSAFAWKHLLDQLQRRGQRLRHRLAKADNVHSLLNRVVDWLEEAREASIKEAEEDVAANLADIESHLDQMEVGLGSLLGEGGRTVDVLVMYEYTICMFVSVHVCSDIKGCWPGGLPFWNWACSYHVLLCSWLIAQRLLVIFLHLALLCRAWRVPLKGTVHC